MPGPERSGDLDDTAFDARLAELGVAPGQAERDNALLIARRLHAAADRVRVWLERVEPS